MFGVNYLASAPEYVVVKALGRVDKTVEQLIQFPLLN